MNQRNFVVILFEILSITVSCYQIPEPTVERLTPKGLRVSIPDETGIRYFAFHAKINEQINLYDNGEIVGELISSRDNRWTYENTNIVLEPEDVLHYWIYVQFNESSYTFRGNNTKQETRLKNSLSNAANSVCETSITTIHGKLKTCKDRLIFEEQFDNDFNSQERIAANNSWWTREVLMPLDPDYEFAAYRELSKNLEIDNGTLQIIPLISDEEYGDDAILFGKLNLEELCTGSLPSECSRHAVGYNILPPVISARLTTKQSFHFRYGKIEIRAKFPTGDWLYPELWLEPKYKTYGIGYSNGRVILGMARGNENLFKISESPLSDTALGSSMIEFSLRTGPNNNIRENKITMRKDLGTWTESFHIYTTIWNKNGFIFQVDGEDVGRLDPPSNGWFNSNQSFGIKNKMAPYDNEFYITLGLGVGGVRVFPDWTTNGRSTKPWRNVEAKAMLHFWQDRNKWLPSWKNKKGIINSKFQVDYVKVWSV